jgi:hypothetical protein
VGRIYDKSTADLFLESTIIPDLNETRTMGIDYMPVIYPGFSWSNLFPGDPYNQTPRYGGTFYQKQANNVIGAGVDMIYVAMFDEVDEGTAMFKMVETAEELPAGEVFVPLNIDGYNVPKDWYLRLGGQTGGMLRGEIPLSSEIAGLNEYYSGNNILLKVEIITGADWTNLEILNPEVVRRAEITNAEGDITNRSASPSLIVLNQPWENAKNGKTITCLIELDLDGASTENQLRITLKKGSIGWASVKFYQRLNGEEIFLKEIKHFLTEGDSSGLNPLSFSIPINRTP